MSDSQPTGAPDDAAAHRACQAYAAWRRTRRHFGPPPIKPSLLGRLVPCDSESQHRPPPDATCSAELSALHLAIAAMPADSLDRRVLELRYVWRVTNVKATAAALGISRQHWYRVLQVARAKVWAAAQSIAEEQRVQAEITLKRSQRQGAASCE